MGFGAHAFSPAELVRLLEADRAGLPYLALRDADGSLRIVALDEDRLTVGRHPECAVALPWDREVSRVHAALERLGDAWTVVDDGLSRNGTFVGAARVAGRRRLADRDVLRCGRTELLFRAPGAAPDETAVAADVAGLAGITEAQQRVLVALCRPMTAPGGHGGPATNREIATELHLSVEGVRSHVRTLFARFEVPDLPQHRKRAELARRALAAGVVRAGDAGPSAQG